MFFRKINKTPKSVVRHNKINFGTFNSTPQKIDISGIRGPFTGFPLPPFITDTRIKGTLSFAFNLDDYIGMVEFSDLKLLGTADVVFWNKNTNQKFSYHSLIGPRRRFVPKNIVESVCANYRKSRFVKIFWSKKINRISLNFSVHGDNARPSAKCVVHADYAQKESHQILNVSPAPSTRRCAVSWFVPLVVTGGLKIDKKQKEIDWIEETPGLGMLMMHKVYSSFKVNSDSAYSICNLDGRKIGFHFANYDYAPEDDDYTNDNFLFVDNEITLFPSVVISHTFGVAEKWVIQDTENMVDLVFTPKSIENHSTNFLLAKNTYTLIFGNFEGTVMTKESEKIEIKNSFGFVKKNLLRS